MTLVSLLKVDQNQITFAMISKFLCFEEKNYSMTSWSHDLIAIGKKVSGHLTMQNFGRCLVRSFSVFFVIVRFLITFLLPKQTILKKRNSWHKENTKNGQKANPTFYILRHSKLIIFLILLPNKTKQPKETSMSHTNIKNPFFKNKFLDTRYNKKQFF